MDQSALLPVWLQATHHRLLTSRDALPHAMLLLGPHGVGKSLLAHRFAAALLCESPLPDGDACGQCLACGWYEQGNHPDFRLLRPGTDELEPKEGASQEIKIAQVRALADFLAVGAHRAGRKIVLIDPADALNIPAANALLKTLEEPSGLTIFLLVASRADSLPATIRSRCVVNTIALPSRQEALAWLQSRLQGDPADLHDWLAAAGGSPLQAAAMAEADQAAAYRMIVQTLSDLPENSPLSAAAALSAVPARTWIPMMQAWISDLARISVGGTACRFPKQSARLESLSRNTTLDRIVGYAQWLLGQARSADHPLNPRLFCEDTLLRYRSIFLAAQGRSR